MQNFWLRSPLEASKRVNVKEMDLNQLVAVGGRGPVGDNLSNKLVVTEKREEQEKTSHCV